MAGAPAPKLYQASFTIRRNFEGPRCCAGLKILMAVLVALLARFHVLLVRPALLTRGLVVG